MNNNIKNNECTTNEVCTPDSKFSIHRTTLDDVKNSVKSYIRDLNETIKGYFSDAEYAINKSAQPPHFENTEQGAKEACEWLNKNNSKYKYTIEPVTKEEYESINNTPINIAEKKEFSNT